MATVIDSLLVTLGIDSSMFKKGQKEASAGLKQTSDEAARAAKELEARGKQAAQFYTKIKNEVISLGAAYLSFDAFKSFTSNLNTADSAVFRLSKNIGISTEKLSAWQGVAKKFGSSADDIDAAFRNTAKIATEFQQTGTSGATEPLVRMKVDVSKFAARTTTAEERMKMLQGALVKMSAQEALLWGQRAGFSEQTITMLREVGSGLDDQLAAQAKLNSASEEDGKRAIARAQAWQRLSDKFEAIGRKILSDLTPAIEAFGRVLDAVLDFADEHMTATEVVVGVLATALTALSVISFIELLGGLKGIVAGIEGAGAAATTASVAIGGMLKMLAGGAAVAAGFAAGYAIGTAIEKGITGVLGESLGSWLFNKFHPENLNTPTPIPRKPLPTSTKTPPAAPKPAAIAQPQGKPAETPVTPQKPSAQGQPRIGSSAPRGIRNNNPGNLNFVGQEGATKEEGAGGRFAVFKTMQEGIAALAKQLQLYGKRGTDTVRGIISKYAPAGENNTEAYIKSVMGKLGVGAEEHLDLKNNAVLKALIEAITNVEVGKGKVKSEEIEQGVAMNNARANMKLASAAPDIVNNRNIGGNTSRNTNTDVKVGSIVVQTQATDANGIAKDIGKAVEMHTFTSQANMGLA